MGKINRRVSPIQDEYIEKFLASGCANGYNRFGPALLLAQTSIDG